MRRVVITGLGIISPIGNTAEAVTASLRDALQWSGERSLPVGGLGRFALKAHAAVSGGTIALSNLNAELDGNVGEGVVSYATTGRQMLQGTLAVEKLDLRPYVSAFRLIADNTRDWDRRSFVLDWFNGWDADLRLSAASVQFAHAELGRTAIAANTTKARPEASNPMQVAQLKNDSPRPPLGPKAARDTVNVEVPVFGPCRLARPTATNARLPSTIATTDCMNDSPSDTTTAPFTT